MATLTLPLTFVNLMATGAFVSGQAAIGRAEAYAQTGNVYTLAGGRRRAIISKGEISLFSFELRFIPRASVDTLRTWIGQLVQVRDTKSRRFFGVYFDLPITEIVSFAPLNCSSTTLWHVGINLNAVTTAEGV